MSNFVICTAYTSHSENNRNTIRIDRKTVSARNPLSQKEKEETKNFQIYIWDSWVVIFLSYVALLKYL